MSNPFAALETATATACCAALSNASLIYAGRATPGTFDAAWVDRLGMDSSKPRFVVPSATLTGLVAGDAVKVRTAAGDAAYTVRSVQPDGTGTLTLLLETA